LRRSPSRVRRVLTIAVMATLALIVGFESVVIAATPIFAVPLPRPAPKARDAAMTDATPRSSAPLSIAPGSSSSSTMPPVPVIPDQRNVPPLSAPGVFDANQRALVAKVSAYLSSINTLVGNFVQVGPDGSRTKGSFYIQKPGKVRFDYDDPSPISIIADGSSVVVRDNRLATQDLYPLSQTPLRFLLSDRIDLIRDTNVVSVSADDTYITVVIEEKQLVIGTSRLMMMFGAKDTVLKQWTVTDPQGYDTTIAVYNLDTSKKLDPTMFIIDTTSNPGGLN
jgi:outer membrane lipoprotein-sorting protein